MAEVFVVLIEDSHCDTEPYVFSDRQAALDYAEQELPTDRYDEDELERDLNDMMVRAGWIYYARYGESRISVRTKVVDDPNAEGTQ